MTYLSFSNPNNYIDINDEVSYNTLTSYFQET